jgi:hypothetical protein
VPVHKTGFDFDVPSHVPELCWKSFGAAFYSSARFTKETANYFICVCKNQDERLVNNL